MWYKESHQKLNCIYYVPKIIKGSHGGRVKNYISLYPADGYYYVYENKFK